MNIIYSKRRDLCGLPPLQGDDILRYVTPVIYWPNTIKDESTWVLRRSPKFSRRFAPALSVAGDETSETRELVRKAATYLLALEDDPAIRIHYGTSPKDSAGCLLIGRQIGGAYRHPAFPLVARQAQTVFTDPWSLAAYLTNFELISALEAQ